MTTAKSAVEVRRPATDVFAYLSNIENETNWREGVTNVTLKAGKTAEAGAVYTERVSRMGMTSDLEIEITELAPGERLTYRFSSNGPFEGLTSYEVTPVSTSCVVRSTIDLGGGLMAKAMGGMLGKLLDKDLQQLKGLLES